PGAVLRAATAAPELLELRGVRFVEHDAVVVGQLLARADVAQGDDEDLVLLRAPLRVFLDLGLAVRIAAVVDPARDVAADVRVDHVMVVEREQEGVAVFVLVAVFLVDLVVGTQLAAVLDDALALPDRRDGEDAVAVDRGLAGFDLLFLHLGRGRENGTPIVARAAFDTRPRPVAQAGSHRDRWPGAARARPPSSPCHVGTPMASTTTAAHAPAPDRAARPDDRPRDPRLPARDRRAGRVRSRHRPRRPGRHRPAGRPGRVPGADRRLQRLPYPRLRRTRRRRPHVRMARRLATGTPRPLGHELSHQPAPEHRRAR